MASERKQQPAGDRDSIEGRRSGKYAPELCIYCENSECNFVSYAMPTHNMRGIYSIFFYLLNHPCHLCVSVSFP